MLCAGGGAMKVQQRGFTLVELMVAMLIGLILTLAAPDWGA